MSESNTDLSQLSMAEALAQAEKEVGTSPGNPSTTSEGQESPDTPQSDPDPLKGVEVSALLSHPELGPKLKSHIDTEHANQSRGSRATIERELRASLEPEITRQVTEKVVGDFLSDLSNEERASYFADHPNLAVVYGRYQEAKSSPDPASQSSFNPIVTQIRSNMQRIETANFTDEVRAKLHPDNYRNMGNDGLQKWTDDITDALIAQKVATTSETQKEAERTAKLAEEDSGGPLMNHGRATDVLGDIENDPTQSLLERAFAINSASAKKG